MAKQSDWGTEFVNVDVKHKPAMYFDAGKVPTIEELLTWSESLAPNFWRFGLSYNERSRSYIVSATDKGTMKVTEKSKTISQHGKNFYTAWLKIYIVLEVCQVTTEGWDYGLKILEVIEERIEIAIERLLSE